MPSVLGSLEASGVRIDVDGAPVLEGFEVKASGNVVVLGAPRALFEVCAGIRALTAGKLTLDGISPREGLLQGALASAPMDVPVPPRWRVRDLVLESAQLAGHGRKEGVRRASEAMHALGLEAVAGVKLGAAELPVKRAAMIAAALATGAHTLVVEDFTPGLADAAARSLGRLFVAACKERRWLLFAGKLALSSPVGLNADEAVLFQAGRVVASGPPAEIAARERTYSVRLGGAEPGPFVEALRERGASVSPHDDVLTVGLPEGLTPLDLVRLAADKSVVVIELLPVSDALV